MEENVLLNCMLTVFSQVSGDGRSQTFPFWHMVKQSLGAKASFQNFDKNGKSQDNIMSFHLSKLKYKVN